MTGTLTLVTAGGSRRRVGLDALVDQDRAREETYRWIKSLRSVRYGDVSMRRKFTFRGDSLWWFTEIYLHKMRRLETAVATLLALESATRDDAPARVTIESDDPVVRKAALQFSAHRRLPVEIEHASHVTRVPSHGWNSYLIGLSATLSRLRPRARPRHERAAVVAFVHTAFWNVSAAAGGVGQERYIGPILDAVAARIPAGDLVCVGVGPRRNFRTRRWWDPVAAPGAGRPLVTPIEQLASRTALKDAIALWSRRETLAAEVVAGSEIRAAAVVRGCDLWDVLRPELEQVARLQWPWSARAMDEAGAAIDRLAPSVVVTYAEAGGWGRALMLEARRRHVASAGLQHGFIYRDWLNYRHEPDEMMAEDEDRGFPRPDQTLVFDRYAASTLESTGRFPAGAIAVVGSPRLDEMTARVRAETDESRAALRNHLRVPADGALVVVAAKFTEIAGVLPSFLAEVATRRSLRVVIKPHPAESAAVYAPLVAGIPNAGVLSTEADLGQLLHAADGFVTMNSTIAIDALGLGVPSLVIGLPSNLSPFVDAGVMLGSRADTVGPALDALLYDRDARAAMLTRAAAFAARYGMSSDGRAAGRAADAIVSRIRQ